MMNRQFANMIVHNYPKGVYSLRRINLMEHLFYPSTEAAQKAEANKKGWLSTMLKGSPKQCLPKTNINFSSLPNMADLTARHFFSLLKGQGEGSVMFVSPNVHTMMYDTSTDFVFGMPQANFCKQSDSISLSITRRGYGQEYHELYVIGKGEDGGLFEVLKYTRTTDLSKPPWYWRPLPCPPLFPQCLPGGNSKVCAPSAAVVLDATTICASSVDAGACAFFDTVTREWRQAGSWVLPVHGAAEYVPEFGLWFGLDDAIGNPNHCLCAFDFDSSRQPVVRHSWSYLSRLPDECLPRQRHLLNMGSGKFCIATSFRNLLRHTSCTPLDGAVDELTILTGVEVVRDVNGFQIIKHKSECYSLEDNRIHCVL
ncbi:hypothetical protein VPH35_090782 [Triticum aestivum]